MNRYRSVQLGLALLAIGTASPCAAQMYGASRTGAPAAGVRYLTEIVLGGTTAIPIGTDTWSGVADVGATMACDGSLLGFRRASDTSGEVFIAERDTLGALTGAWLPVQTFTVAPSAAAKWAEHGGVGFAIAPDGTPLVIRAGGSLAGPGSVFQLNVVSGEIELVGVGDTRMGAIAYRGYANFTLGPPPLCQLYAVANTASNAGYYLTTIDPNPGTSDIVTSSLPLLTPANPLNFLALEFDDAGALFASRGRDWFTIDPGTGAASSVSCTSGPCNHDGLGFWPPIAHDCLVKPTVAITPVAPIYCGECALLTPDPTGTTDCNGGGLTYSWREGSTEVCDTETCLVCPTATTTYTLTVECANTIHGCPAIDAVTVEVIGIDGADAGPDILVCAGQDATLDGSGSAIPGCTELLYTWSDPTPSTICSSTAPTCVVSPAVAGSYQLEAVCNDPGAPYCPSTDDVNLELLTITAVAGDDFETCDNAPFTLDGSGSTASGCTDLRYTWTGPASTGCPISPDPECDVFPPYAGFLTYELTVECADPGSPSCPTTDEVVVEAKSCSLGVHWDCLSATIVSSTSVAVHWSTVWEEGTTLFAVLRGPSATGPFVEIGEVPARGGRGTYCYVFHDDSADPGERFYRLQEYDGGGIGDLSLVFEATLDPPCCTPR